MNVKTVVLNCQKCHQISQGLPTGLYDRSFRVFSESLLSVAKSKLN